MENGDIPHARRQHPYSDRLVVSIRKSIDPLDGYTLKLLRRKSKRHDSKTT